MKVFNGKLLVAMDGATNYVKKYSGTGNISDLEAGYDHTTVSKASSTTTRTVVLGESFKGESGDYAIVAGLTEVAEVTTLQFIADVSGSYNNKYFYIYSAKDATGYYVWFNVNSAGVDPAISGKTAVPIAIATNASADTIATAVKVALDALADFGASVVTDTVTVTNASGGNTTDATNAGSVPSLTITVTTQGLTWNGTYAITGLSTTSLTNDTIQYTAAGSGTFASAADTGGSVDSHAPNGNIVAEHQGRCLLTDKDDLDGVHYSATFNHEKWWGYGDSGRLDVSSDDNDPIGITGIFPTFNGDLFIAKKTKLVRVVGVIPFHQMVTVSESIGCISHESIAAIDKTDIIWASTKGVHSLATTINYGDYEEAFISKDIQSSFNEDWEQSRQKYLKGRYLATENLYLLGVTEEELGTQNNCVWAYNTSLKKWISRWPNVDCESIFIANDADQVRPYFGSSTGRVYKGWSGNRYDTNESGADVAISLLAETGLIFPSGSPYSINGFKKVVLFYTPRGNQTISVNVKVDAFSPQSTAFDESSGGTPLGTGWVLGSTALGSEGMFAPYNRQIDGYGYGVKITISESARLSSYSIEGIGIEYQPMEISHDVNKGAIEN